MKGTVTICRLQMVREEKFEYDVQIKQSDDVYELALKLGYADFAEEVFGMFCVNSKGNVVDYMEVSHGNLNSSVVHPREVFKRALLANAAAILLVHNHPSGSTEPSDEDISTTRRLVEAGKLMGVEIVDHIIVGDCNYTSMKSQGIGDL